MNTKYIIESTKKHSGGFAVTPKTLVPQKLQRGVTVYALTAQGVTRVVNCGRRGLRSWHDVPQKMQQGILDWYYGGEDEKPLMDTLWGVM